MGPEVSLITPSFEGGGVEKVMVNLAAGLARAGLVVDLVAISPQGPFRTHVGPGIRVVDLAAPRMIRALPGLVRYFRKERPDAALSGLDYLNVGALLANQMAGSPTRVVVSTHKYFSLASQRSDLRRVRWLLPWAAQFTYPLAHRVVAIAEAMADDLADAIKFSRRKILVIPNPVVTPELSARTREPASHPWLSEVGPPTVVGLGRLHAEKDFGTLLRAFALLQAKMPARLIILGEGPERPALERLTSELGITGVVDLPGFVPNPYAVLARAHLFVLSSRNEGLPTALIEAMACGCPVVSTDCPSGPEEVLEGGRYGPLTPVGDADSLAQAMVQVLVDPPPPEKLKRRAEAYHVDRAVTHYRSALEV